MNLSPNRGSMVEADTQTSAQIHQLGRATNI
jgi:hypothetical protein